MQPIVQTVAVKPAPDPQAALKKRPGESSLPTLSSSALSVCNLPSVNSASSPRALALCLDYCARSETLNFEHPRQQFMEPLIIEAEANKMASQPLFARRSKPSL